MTKFTKSPWELTNDKDVATKYNLIALLQDNEEYVGVITKGQQICNKEQWKMNARLIKESPKMLDFIKNVKEYFDDYHVGIFNSEPDEKHPFSKRADEFIKDIEGDDND